VQQIREAFAGLRGEIRQVSGPKERLTPEQLGEANPYAGIYTSIFRMTGIAHPEHIVQGDFPDVLAFLDRQIDAVRSRLRDHESTTGNYPSDEG
jgi:hypothetical protein